MLVHTINTTVEIAYAPWGEYEVFIGGTYRPDLDHRLVLALLYGYAWSDWDEELVSAESEDCESALLALIEHGVERCEDWIRWAGEADLLGDAVDRDPCSVARAAEYRGHIENHPPL